MKGIREVVLSALLIPGVSGGQSMPSKDLDPSLTCNASGWPTVVRAEAPLYPQLATQAHLSGVVDVAITIKDGTVVKAESRSAASPILVNAALSNAKTWQFGAGVNTDISIRYVYVLIPSLQSPIIEMKLPRCVTIKAEPAKEHWEHSTPATTSDR